MDGQELLSRIIISVQEMYLKIGDSKGSISLYYPFEGDTGRITREFSDAKKDAFPDVTLDILPGRLRATVCEEDCIRISGLPMRRTMASVIGFTREYTDLDRFCAAVKERFPDSRIYDSGCVDFDRILLFPEDPDDDVYCLSQESGAVTYHRFSKDEFAAMGFSIPIREDR